MNRAEKFYSKNEGQAYLAELPRGYAGQFGPGVKALTLVLYHAANMSEPKVREFFGFVGVHISKGGSLEPADQRPGRLPR